MINLIGTTTKLNLRKLLVYSFELTDNALKLRFIVVPLWLIIVPGNMGIVPNAVVCLGWACRDLRRLYAFN